MKKGNVMNALQVGLVGPEGRQFPHGINTEDCLTLLRSATGILSDSTVMANLLAPASRHGDEGQTTCRRRA